MLGTQSNPVLHGNLVAPDLELCHIFHRWETRERAGKASRQAFILAAEMGWPCFLCGARDYHLTL